MIFDFLHDITRLYQVRFLNRMKYNHQKCLLSMIISSDSKNSKKRDHVSNKPTRAEEITTVQPQGVRMKVCHFVV